MIVAEESYDLVGEVSKVSYVNDNVNDVVDEDHAVKIFNRRLQTFDVFVNVARAQCCSND